MHRVTNNNLRVYANVYYIKSNLWSCKKALLPFTLILETTNFKIGFWEPERSLVIYPQSNIQWIKDMAVVPSDRPKTLEGSVFRIATIEVSVTFITGTVYYIISA